jgi:ribosomal protein L13E
VNLKSRKDVAALLGVTVDAVRRNEKRWGLDRARADLNCRCVRYRTTVMMSALRLRGFVE